ncbi:MAG TPA: hypothetical protein DF774_01480 [Rheinheimera sp.]|uniref:response regulator receiver domain n=1 Tax=Rheinheimera sp. TaxID=1869214 RepID=UPI000EE4029D|nr:response regulator receiver domain [Rheinheimera sp.]HCU64411.1 hypothetical protein [Rheinheimera sp.]
MQQFSQVAKGIIRNTINAAYCIDDEFVEPFSDPHENSDVDTSSTLYKSFLNEGCSLDIRRFLTLDNWNSNQKQYLASKDLLILDWELSAEAPKYAPALNILNDAVDIETLPFVCIYTNAGHLDSVENCILSYYSNPLADRQESLDKLKGMFADKVDELLGKDDYFGDDELAWLMSLSDKYFDACKFKDRKKTLHAEVNEAIALKCKEDFTSNLYKALASAARTLFNLSLQEVLLGLNIVGRKEVSKYASGKYNVERFLLAGDIHCLLINSTVVIICHKAGNQNSVAADKLFTRIAEVIHTRPHNFMSLLSLECRNFYRDKAKSLGKDLSQITDDAFFWHETTVTKNPGGQIEFATFLKDLWNSTLSGDWNVFTPEMMSVLHEYKEAQRIDEKLAKHLASGGKELFDDLAFLNKKYSILRLKPGQSSRLYFGDIFKGKDKYYLCITAHCDCLTPQNINDNYMFIESANIHSLEKGLKAGDTGFHSFFRNPEGRIINVEWKSRPFTIYIPQNIINTEDEIKVSISGKDLSLKYVCTQKENYTQRIANKSFSFANRVGINFADIKAIPDNTDSLEE